MANFMDKMKNAWNAFTYEEEKEEPYVPFNYGSVIGLNNNRPYSSPSNERSIVSSIYTQISMDAASVDMRHVRLDDNERYSEDMSSGLNNCLTLEANVDQSASAFKQDIYMSLMEHGAIAIVPVDTSDNPNDTGSYDILTMRVGTITQWYPRHVMVNLYDDRVGTRKDVMVCKENAAIVYNPLYAVMNEPNSTLKRLTRKLALLDTVDEASSSGKLDLIIQLPYTIKSEARKKQAEDRKKDLEFQLKGSKYGIAYLDGTEKVTQLNRPAENNLMKQIESLTETLYNQLGITQGVFDGTADEAAMNNYRNRTVTPILTAVAEEMKRTFLTKAARTQKQSVEFFRDPFQFVTVSQLAEVADKFTRNEVLSSNEVRAYMGIKPSKQPKADELRNKNLPVEKTESPITEGELQNDTNS